MTEVAFGAIATVRASREPWAILAGSISDFRVGRGLFRWTGRLRLGFAFASVLTFTAALVATYLKYIMFVGALSGTLFAHSDVEADAKSELLYF